MRGTRDQHDGRVEPQITRTDTAEYLADMLKTLGALAVAARLEFLAYLIGVAWLEATHVGKDVAGPGGPAIQ